MSLIFTICTALWRYVPSIFGGKYVLVKTVQMHVFAWKIRKHKCLDNLHRKLLHSYHLLHIQHYIWHLFNQAGFGSVGAWALVKQYCLFRQSLEGKTFVKALAKQLCFNLKGTQTQKRFRLVKVANFRELCPWTTEYHFYDKLTFISSE